MIEDGLIVLAAIEEAWLDENGLLDADAPTAFAGYREGGIDGFDADERRAVLPLPDKP